MANLPRACRPEMEQMTENVQENKIGGLCMAL